MRHACLQSISRIVVKLGTGVLTDSQKKPDPAQFAQLADQLASLKQAGKEVVVVTSGAVGAGMGALGFDKRPSDLATQQACAAIGQSKLMSTYEGLFNPRGIPIAQVLLTHDDLEHHERHLNARNTLVTLLRHQVIPIINENDAVSSTELKFGDNDKLSALVASLLPADLLVILTTVEGMFHNYGKPDARRISIVESIDSDLEGHASGTTSATAVGGMATKLQAAKIATRSGIPLIIASGRKPQLLAGLLAGEDDGTLFLPKEGKLRGRKRWIAFFHKPKGSLFVDRGAMDALRDHGRSLLAPGVQRVEGEFAEGDVVRICDADGLEFARGIARFSALQFAGEKHSRLELIHRDDLVVL
ncbi:MAG: glutamate 5-kinase [Verrucomicrobia bacterium]|nr:glutamate 5-kinase [Verrucomicrobiota bacterium]